MKRRPSRAEMVLAGSERARAQAQERRRKKPHLYIDAFRSEILYVENVAELLGASVDTIRRIPAHQLPRKKIGRRSIYLRSDVDEYARSVVQPKTRNLDKHTAGRTAPRKTSIAGPDFDPTAFVRNSLGDKRK